MRAVVCASGMERPRAREPGRWGQGKAARRWPGGRHCATRVCGPLGWGWGSPEPGAQKGGGHPGAQPPPAMPTQEHHMAVCLAALGCLAILVLLVALL